MDVPYLHVNVQVVVLEQNQTHVEKLLVYSVFIPYPPTNVNIYAILIGSQYFHNYF